MADEQCEFCQKASERQLYVCPRCDLRYCSVACYQSAAHEHCSEAFYKGCVNEQLTARTADGGGGGGERNEIIEQMRRIVDESRAEAADSDDSDDEAADEDYLQRVAVDTQARSAATVDEAELDRQLTSRGVGLDVGSLLAQLTPSERRAFADCSADALAEDGSAQNESVFRKRPKQ